jgi:hypothetical protein
MSYIGTLAKELVGFTAKSVIVFITAILLIIVGGAILLGNARNVVNGMPHEISAEGKATRKVSPDSASITLAKIIRGNNIAELQTKGADAVNQLTTKLVAAGVKTEQIKTSNYSLNPTYNTNGDVRDYEINIAVTVTLEKVNPQNELLNKVIQAGSDAGINEVRNLNFYLADADVVAKELEEAAIADAKASAEKRARAIGATLGKAIRVDVGSNGGSPIPYATRAQTFDTMEAKAATDVNFNVGQFDLDKYVTVVYELN